MAFTILAWILYGIGALAFTAVVVTAAFGFWVLRSMRRGRGK